MPLTISDRSPVPDAELTVAQAIQFILNGSLALPSVILGINDTVVYADEAARGSYSVVRTVLSGTQTRYAVTATDGWSYGAALTPSVYAEDTLADVFMDRWDLDVVEDPTCFTGPITSFEESLLLPYSHYDSTLRFTEQLRTLLLDLAVARPQANRAVRWLFLRAHSNELAPVLRTLVPTPTTAELAVRLCGQRSNVTVDAALRGKPGLLTSVMRELQTLGLPPTHAAMLQRYDIDDPNARVPMSCLAVCLAKVLETGTLAG